MQGVVKFFNEEKGWGFIRPDGGGKEVFCHYSDIQTAGFKTLEKGQKVEFEVVKTDKGHKAANVTPV